MGFFDIFKKKKGFDLPSMYKGIVNRDQYNLIMQTAIQYHQEKSFTITKIDEGEIVIEDNGDKEHRYLDNLVRNLASYDPEDWKNAIYEHFDKLKYNSAAFDYLYKDFSYAAQFLRVLVKGPTFNFPAELGEYISRVDFPETNTFLILEFEGQFHYVRKEDILEWEKTEEELFEIALDNIPENEIETNEYDLNDQFKLFIFFSGDYAASYILNLKEKADYVIGNYGTLLAIPTKGTVYTHPIEKGNILELITILGPTIAKFYNEDPGNITLNYYWYYNDKFEVFPIGQDSDGYFISLPENLHKLLNN
ncbi:hypothetical protein ACFFLS_13080 [Flavobacterium procerum]|uniref:Uncharacterized protein n=1 Tax=Flavobacterium procerum TaxID=1455569 RepID=A0ABV6BRA7_9FLAO